MVISSHLESRSQCSPCPSLEPWPDPMWSSQSREKNNTQVIFHKCSHFLRLVPQRIINGIISGVRTFGFCVPFLFLCEAMSLHWVEHSVMKTAVFNSAAWGKGPVPGQAWEKVKPSPALVQHKHHTYRDKPWRRWLQWWWWWRLANWLLYIYIYIFLYLYFIYIYEV